MKHPAGSHPQDVITGYWSQRAPSYDDYQQRPERQDLDRQAWRDIWSAALPLPPADVLDVGTGSGHVVACLLADLGHRVTGIDLADGMLARAREHAASRRNPPRILTGDAVRPNFPAGSFDAVTGRYVLWTLREPGRAITAWLELLRPGGVVALADSTWYPDGVVDLYDETTRAALPHAGASTIDAFAQILEQSGLTDVQVQPLWSILDLDRRLGVAPGHAVRLQYLISGRRPT